MKRSILFILFLALMAKSWAQPIPSPNPIKPDWVEVAQRLIDLDFSAAERDSMCDGLFEQLQSYQQLRRIPLPNSVFPALLFNPIPQGFNWPEEKRLLQVNAHRRPERPDNLEDLAYCSLGELAALLKSQKVTSEELTFMFLQRLKKVDPMLHCVITLTESRALNKARQADAAIKAGRYKGLLHGIPYGIKDLLSTKGYNTTWGSMPYKDQYIDEDATVVRKLDEAGAVLVAKLSMGALAWGDVWFGGKTRTPWDTSRGSSGSSAGSAAAVAAGLVPFAIGTETWGSIVSPATACGVTGLRPTYGRVSRTGAMALSWSMDKIGVLCRCAEDAAIVLDAIYGPDGSDPTVYDVPFHYQADLEINKLKIGYLKSDFSSDYAFRTTDSLSLEMLRSMGVRLVPFELPDVPVHAISFILESEAAAAFDALTRSNHDSLMVRQIKNAWPNVFRHARFIPAVEYINANRLRYLLVQQMEEKMQQVDLYAAPSRYGVNLLLTNLTGHPSITIPNGFRNGLPTSITLVGKLFDEGTIIAVAQQLQQASGFHLKQPELTATQ
ncbi:amidase [candidate division KSB1 bacterium]|nr:amidase [candidate division KSB1 bacterium]